MAGEMFNSSYSPFNNYNFANTQPYQNNNMQQQQQQRMSIKGKYIGSIEDVIAIQSNDLEPAVCVDLANNKIYIKTFNVDGSYKVEEFVKNENAKIDTRSQAEKLNDVVIGLSETVKSLSEEFNLLKRELGGTPTNSANKKGGN